MGEWTQTYEKVVNRMSLESLKVQVIKKAWEDPAFKQRLLADPKAAVKDAFGVDLPQEIQVTTVEETASHYYLVIPRIPKTLRTDLITYNSCGEAAAAVSSEAVSSARGSRMITSVPSPFLLLNSIVPFMTSMILNVTIVPSPVPLDFVEK